MGWAIVSALGAIGLIFVAIIGGGTKLIFMLGRLHAQLEQLKKEFKPNGGSSLKDDINTLKGDIRDLNTKHEEHLKQHAGQWR